MSKGWSSEGLAVTHIDAGLWTAADASRLLGPPELDTDEVRGLIRRTGMQPVGKRRTTPDGTSGRYARVYLAVDFIRAWEDGDPSAPGIRR